MLPVELTPAQREALARRLDARLASCVPWRPNMKWQRELNLRADSWDLPEPFPGVVPSDLPVDALERGMFVDSPQGTFRYCVRLHRRGRPLLTWWRGQSGTVIFDGDVAIPALFQRRPAPDEARWMPYPWMSLTPAELLSLRPGTRLARGHTVVAGLGLGHQLVEVSRRVQVKRVTLVELSAELVDWLLPQIRPRIRRPLAVEVGDAFEVLPRLRADVALVDIYPEYGGNARATERLARTSPGIRRVWGWGDEKMVPLRRG